MFYEEFNEIDSMLGNVASVVGCLGAQLEHYVNNPNSGLDIENIANLLMNESKILVMMQHKVVAIYKQINNI